MYFINYGYQKNQCDGVKERFEGLLTYYVKMNVGQFIKQWVTPKLYHELLE